MAGKRLLDAAVVLKASRAIVSKHIALRQQQLDTYTKTSSLINNIKSRTDRVTITVRTAEGIAEQLGQSSGNSAPGQSTRVPTQDSVGGGKKQRNDELDVEQDHFYENSRVNTTAQPPPKKELYVQQEKAKRYALPDGSIPPVYSHIDVSKRDLDNFFERRTKPSQGQIGERKEGEPGDLEPTSSTRTSIPNPIERNKPPPADHARQLQRNAEREIPSLSEEPPNETVSTLVDCSSNDQVMNLSADLNHDVLYAPPLKATRVFSSLSRVKLPNATKDEQKENLEDPDKRLNQDVYYSAAPTDTVSLVPEIQVMPEEEEPPGDTFSELFHSPRVSKLLQAKQKQKKPAKNLEPHIVQDMSAKQSKLPQEKDQESLKIRPIGQNTPKLSESSKPGGQSGVSKKVETEDVKRLAEDMMQNSANGSSIEPRVRAVAIHSMEY